MAWPANATTVIILLMSSHMAVCSGSIQLRSGESGPWFEFGLKYVVQLQPYIVHMLHVGKGNILPRRQSTCTFEVHSI
jgi:hypothetical protein